MPIWAWGGFVVIISYFGFRLLRAARTGTEKYAIFDYRRDSDPLLFWFFVSIDLLGFVFMSAFLILVIVSAIWGPVFHQ